MRTQEQHALLHLVREVSRRQIAPRAEQHESAGTFPAELFALLAELDVLGLPFPTADGGGGQPSTVVSQVLAELSRSFLAVGLGTSVHLLATGVVAAHASRDVRADVLPRLISGEWLAAYSLSEPDSGSDAAALTTKARLDGDSYVINGTKAWVTHAGQADCYVMFCRTGEHRTRGITALLVPADTGGLEFPPPERKLGLRASPTGQIVCHDVRVPARYRLGDEGEGLGIALTALDSGRLGIASCAIGLARAALHAAIAYARSRRQFGRPIGAFQGIGFTIADMASAIEAADALCQRAAAANDAGRPTTTLAAMAKLVATDTAMRVTDSALQIHGGAGYTTAYPVERYLREAKVLQLVEGTNQIQRVVISRNVMGDLD
ncbi:MAG TPA: acyl-CoA dehydrogenase family protein [Euzebyales bacterium]|nr:acyl-CoA dehydrogenase family protein [Euzebyales bacterium]